MTGWRWILASPIPAGPLSAEGRLILESLISLAWECVEQVRLASSLDEWVSSLNAMEGIIYFLREVIFGAELKCATEHVSDRDFAAAREQLERLLRRYPSCDAALRSLGEMHLAAGALEAAERTVIRALLVAPDVPETWIAQHQVLVARGRQLLRPASAPAPEPRSPTGCGPGVQSRAAPLSARM